MTLNKYEGKITDCFSEKKLFQSFQHIERMYRSELTNVKSLTVTSLCISFIRRMNPMNCN